MPPTTADRLVHILAAIETIQNALAGKELNDLTAHRDLPPLKSFAERATR